MLPVIECCSRQEWTDTLGNSFSFQTIKLTDYSIVWLLVYTTHFFFHFLLYTMNVILSIVFLIRHCWATHTHTHTLSWLLMKKKKKRQIDWRRLINEYFCLKLTLDYSSSLISCDSGYVYININGTRTVKIVMRHRQSYIIHSFSHTHVQLKLLLFSTIIKINKSPYGIFRFFFSPHNDKCQNDDLMLWELISSVNSMCTNAYAYKFTLLILFIHHLHSISWFT